jgi:hypothetical protein
VKQLIKRILREEFRNLSSDIEELLQPTVDKYSDYVCGVQVFQDVMNPKKYSLRVIFVGGSGSKGWPMTQAIHDSHGKVMKEMWETIYKFTGLSVELDSTTVRKCGGTIIESTNDRLEKLVGDYITMSYPTAKKIRVSPPNVDGSITTFALPNPEDERDSLIFKFEIFGKPEYHMNPDFFNSIHAMFGRNKNIKKIILKWFNDKEVDVDLLQDSDEKKQEQNESELTERCWKGYTQKGMKTMFGKRYPNCVKVKKESVNEASLADYLKKLVSSTRPDPMRDFQKVVDLITKVTKREVPVEGLVGVQVVDTNKQMWGANYMDDKDKGRRWDFTVVLRLVFTSEKDFDESDRQIIKFKDEFTNNAYGMGLMNTSPITNKKVKDYKVNFMFDMKYPFVISQQM